MSRAEKRKRPEKAATVCDKGVRGRREEKVCGKGFIYAAVHVRKNKYTRLCKTLRLLEGDLTFSYYLALRCCCRVQFLVDSFQCWNIQPLFFFLAFLIIHLCDLRLIWFNLVTL